MAHSSLGSFALKADRVETGPIRGPGLAYRYAFLRRGLAVTAVAAVALLALLTAGTLAPSAAAGSATAQTKPQADAAVFRWDWAGVGSSPFSAFDVSNVTVVHGSPSAAEGARTQYRVNFTATGGLSEAADDRITTSFPTGTGLAGVSGAVFNTSDVQIGSCFSASGLSIQCFLNNNVVVSPNQGVRLVFSGVTNPAAGSHTLNVSTTTDPTPVQSAAYTVVADNPVSAISVVHGSPSAAEGARTQYRVNFTTSATGGLAEDANSRITTSFPTGTGLAGVSGAVFNTSDVQIGSCFSANGLSIDCFLNNNVTVNPNQGLRLVFSGVTNPPAGGRTLNVSTTSDTAPVASPTYTVVADNPVSAISVVHGSPSAAEGARTQYRVNFTTSATGGLAEDANSRITISFPTGTGLAGVSGAVFNTSDVQIGSCFSANGLSIDCFLNNNVTVNPNQGLRLVFSGVTNPAAGSHTLNVSTTSDTAPVASPSYTIVNDNPVSAISVVHGSPSAAEGARTQYRVNFTTSATGGLAEDANSRITTSFPTGTGLAGVSGAVFNTSDVQIGSCFSANGLSIDCFLNNNVTVNPNQGLRLVFSGVTNPAGRARTLNVSTTSDTTPVASPSYTVVADNPVSAISVVHGSPSAAEGARTQYRVNFTTSATGGLAEDANSRITTSFPTGTGLAGVSGAVFNTSDVQIGSCFSANGLSIDCFLNNNVTVNPNQGLRLVFSGVTNPPAGGRTLNVSTTSDTTPVASPTYTVVADNPVSGVTLTLDSDAPGVTTRWVPRFTTSATGGLAEDANSRITVSFPTGTGLAGVSGAVFNTSDVQIGSCFSANGLSIDCFLNNNTTVNPNQALRLNFTGVTNPSSAGPWTVDVSTTSDTTPVTSDPSTAGDSTPPDTVIDSGPSGTIGDSTPTFTFSSNEPGSTFRCSVDGGAFSACNTPFTTAALADGSHTFAVFAIDPAGNPDLSAASSTFTITTADTTPPDASITAGPSGPTEDETPSFEFNATEPGSSFECSIDGGAFAACSSPFTTPALPAGQHTFSVRARDGAGNLGPAATTTFTVEAQQIEDLPVPTLGEEVNVGPVPGSGPVLIAVPAGATAAARAHASQKGLTFVPLTEARQIPTGSFLDTRRGTVEMQSATGQGQRVQSGKFSAGLFQALQSRRRRDRGLTELRLKGGSFNRCGSSGGRKASASARVVRRVRSNAVGRFRTRGRNSSATVRGTIWTTTDRCDGTLTQVRRGTVVVRDFRRRRNVVVRAGKSYLARARG